MLLYIPRFTIPQPCIPEHEENYFSTANWNRSIYRQNDCRSLGKTVLISEDKD